jgi:hypothetical protein
MEGLMVKLKYLLLTGLSVCYLFAGTAFTAVYEASTLHNAVARSETVMDLFLKRWDIIQDQELFLDTYLKLNWVPGFTINYLNQGTNKIEPVDMRLIRTYGSITLNYPILTGFSTYSGKDLEARLLGKKDETDKKDNRTWKPENLILGFTATGFHYGLTSESQIDRGEPGSETVTDYKFSQFFDDVFAASLLYRPYFFIHVGVIINNEIEPNDDGSMSYEFDGIKKRYFIQSDLFSFLNLNASSTDGQVESYSIGMKLNNAFGFFMPILKKSYFPQVKLVYKELDLYNDMPWDTLWVNSNKLSDGITNKTMAMSDDDRESSKLRTFSIIVTENLNNLLFIDYLVEFQKTTETLIEKTTGNELEFAKVREMHLSVGLDFFKMLKVKGYNKFITTIGLSSYWDPSVPIHRETTTLEDNYKLYGWFFATKWEYTFAGMEFKVSKNYSDELRKLVETSDKYMIETSLFMRY